MAGWCGCHMISWLAGFVVTLQLASWFFYHMCRRPASWIHMCKLSTGFDVTCADGQLDLMSHEEMVSWFFCHMLGWPVGICSTCWDSHLVLLSNEQMANWFCGHMCRWPSGFVVTCADSQLVLLSEVERSICMVELVATRFWSPGRLLAHLLK